MHPMREYTLTPLFEISLILSPVGISCSHFTPRSLRRILTSDFETEVKGFSAVKVTYDPKIPKGESLDDDFGVGAVGVLGVAGVVFTGGVVVEGGVVEWGGVVVDGVDGKI